MCRDFDQHDVEGSMRHNTDIGALMNIQLIEKQKGSYRLMIYGIDCVFKPMELFTTGLFPVKKCMNNGSLGWYVNRKFVSYKQIKKVLVITGKAKGERKYDKEF